MLVSHRVIVKNSTDVKTTQNSEIFRVATNTTPTTTSCVGIILSFSDAECHCPEPNRCLQYDADALKTFSKTLELEEAHIGSKVVSHE